MVIFVYYVGIMPKIRDVYGALEVMPLPFWHMSHSYISIYGLGIHIG